MLTKSRIRFLKFDYDSVGWIEASPCGDVTGLRIASFAAVSGEF
jgi:hypothetical protein